MKSVWKELVYSVHMWNKLMKTAKCVGWSLHCTEYKTRLHGVEYKLFECGSDPENPLRSIEMLENINDSSTESY